MSLFLLLPLTGALIGWLTNYLAIKSLFRPTKPRRFWFFELQGLLPKRQAQLAATIGAVVEKELVTAEAISQRLQEGAVRDKIILEVMAQVEASIVEKLPSLLRQVGLELILPVVRKETDRFLDKLLERAEEIIHAEARVKEMVEERINRLDVGQLEKLVFEVSGRELKHIEVLGGVLGAVIGLIQAFLVQYI
ncbi:MAG: DUF445 family protein [Firmicutes bacterium]|nr:DUF445 family protein [Bacillota bacterium]